MTATGRAEARHATLAVASRDSSCSDRRRRPNRQPLVAKLTFGSGFVSGPGVLAVVKYFVDAQRGVHVPLKRRGRRHSVPRLGSAAACMVAGQDSVISGVASVSYVRHDWKRRPPWQTTRTSG